MTKSDLQSEILKPFEVAKLLNITRGTMYRMIRRGGFPDPIVLMKAKCWRRQDILDWIASRPTVKR